MAGGAVNALETVDLDGVEILATGGPVHGRGSAPGGDTWTTEQLRELAKANADLAGELRPPAKLGHGESGDPAVGWLENIRINEDGSRLLADIKRVPRKVGELIRSGAYRGRSVELSSVTSQRTGRRFELAVSGLAFLGASLPAVRTLGDIVALYADDRISLRRVYVQKVVEQAPDDRWLEAALGCPVADVLEGPAELRYEAGDDDDLAERKAIARKYGLDLEQVP